MDKYYKPKCPRCDSADTRARESKTVLFCRRCGYSAHWRQFFPGTKEREEVKKLFKTGKLEGKEVISVNEKQMKEANSARDKYS